MLSSVPVRATVLAVLLLAAGCQPRGPEALRRGDERLRAGQVAEAIPLFERAATDLADDPRAWNFLGLAYQAAGRAPEAQKAYLHALREDRNFFDAHFNLATLHASQGDWAEAERSVRTFLAPDANHNHAGAWSLLGEAQLQLRKLDDAERSLALAAKLAAGDAEVWNNLGLVHAGKRRLQNARQDFAWAVHLDPHHAAARLNLAVTTQQLGDKRGALLLYRDYLSVVPGAANLESVRAQIRLLEAQTTVAPATLPLTNAVAGAKLVTNPPPALKPTVVATNVAATKPAPSLAKPVVEARPAVTKPAELPVAKPLPERTATPPVVNTPPAPKPEVVRVDEGPALRSARDVSPLVPAVVPTVSAPVVTKNEAPAEPAKRRSLWQRANPVSWGNPVKWFRSESPSTNTSKPTTSQAVRPATAANSLPLPESAPSTSAPVNPPAPKVKPKPAKPVVAHYTSRAPTTLPAGNHPAAEAQFNAAVAAHDRHELREAMGLYQRAAELDPSYFAAHHNLGLAALEANDLPRALLAGECATRLDPQSVSARRLFAAALQRANYPAEAAEQLERLLATEPNDAPAQLALAGLYARALGEPDQARPHYERLLELDPQHRQAGAVRVWLSENP
jgi:tetratricopeptide (TPR) repeat protein